MTIKKKTHVLLAIVAMLSLIAAACGSDADGTDAASSTVASTDSTGTPTEDDPGATDAAADSSLAPITIGFDSQEEELFSIIEARLAAEAAVAYVNAELGGVNGRPLELEVCTSGDGPEGSVACAQQFVNNDDISIMITSSFSSNEASEVTVPAGLPLLALANLPDDWQRPTEWINDPGFLGIIQAPVNYAADEVGAATMAIICADDPFFLEACDAGVGFAAAAGMETFDVTPAGFEQADFTGVVTASRAAEADVVLVVIDGSQCAALAASFATLSVESTVLTADTCAIEDALTGGGLDNWLVFGASGLPVNAASATAEILEGQRIIEEYGSADAELFGLAGWGAANVLAARDALLRAGDDITRESVNDALSETQLNLGWYADISCPGPAELPGACVSTVFVLRVTGETMEFEAIAPIDFASFDLAG